MRNEARSLSKKHVCSRREAYQGKADKSNLRSIHRAEYHGGSLYRRSPHFFDLTDVVQALVEQSDIRAGTALVFSKHTTAAIAIIEHEPLLLDDIAEMLWHLIPPSSLYRYRHDDFSVRTINMTEGEPKNGHAHCQHLFIGASCHLPVIEGSLELGQWQRIFLVELDRARTRQVVIQVSGVAEHS